MSYLLFDLIFNILLAFGSAYLGYRLAKAEDKRLYTVTDEDYSIIAEINEKENNLKVVKGYNILIDGYDVKEVAKEFGIEGDEEE